MNIFALVTDAFGGSGGIAQYNRDFLEALAECQLDSEITVFPRHAQERFRTPNGIIQRKASPSRLVYVFKILLASIRSNVNLVFCGHIFIAPLALLIARLKGAKLIVQMHGIEAWARPTWLQRIAVESADFVLCVSRFTRARVAAWAALEPARLIVLPNTVGDDFTPSVGSRFRAQWNLFDKKVLLTVGRLDSNESYKGHDRIIAAMPSLVAAGHELVYVILGEGDDRSRLESLAQACGVNNRVRFMGAVDRQTLIDAYRSADLFVMPSTGEGFGIVFLEAMACGTPALGLAVAGTVDAFGDGRLGVTVSELDLVPALGQILRSSRPDPWQLAAEVRARFGRSTFRTRVLSVLDRVTQSV